tara:strand:- start:19754 stop:20647 length:894 start_codon:yes stop_codon:yes gene_type:complete
MVCNNKKCSQKEEVFIFLNQIPVIVPFNQEKCLLDKKDLVKSRNLGTEKRIFNKRNLIIAKSIKKIFQGANKKTENNFKFLANQITSKTKVLIIGGGSRGDGMDYFYKACERNSVLIESIDIYESENITAIADAHYLPYVSLSFDLVIIQAVIEHVLDPDKVVSEIFRVLKNNGLVYSETPFMQSVHEGAYDFTRYTHSGHRWLFKSFEEISSGVIQGGFTATLFIFSYCLSGFFRNRYIGIFLRIIFSKFAKFLDCLIPNKYNFDVGCGFYFIGKKIPRTKNQHSKWIAKYYLGAQ